MSEDVLQLITAAVDGELSARKAKRFNRLLGASTEARALYEKLKADRDRLRSLPAIPVPAALHAQVMAKIRAVSEPSVPDPIRPAQPAALKPRFSAHEWLPIAVAASILFAIAGTSFWFFIQNNDSRSMARNSDRSPSAMNPGDLVPSRRTSPSDRSQPEPAPMPSVPGARAARPKEQLPVPPRESVAVAIAPAPRTPERDFLGARPLGTLPRFDLVEVRLPFLKPLADLDRDDVRQELIDEFGQDPAFRIDLFSRNVIRGVELFQASARASGLTVHADATTLNFLKKGQLGAVVIYTDSFTAAQLTALFARLGTEDAKVSPRIFDSIHAAPVNRRDEAEIRDVLGVDPGLFKHTPPEKHRAPVKGKSVSAGTADEIVKSITAGQGKTPAAVLLTWSPMQGRTAPALSAELKSYLSKRPARKPGAVPAIIVIRHGNG